MFGLQALEVAIGLSLIFIVVASVSSAVQEAIAQLADWRAKNLSNGLRNMLNGTASDAEGTQAGLANQVLNHGLISSLGKPNKKGGVRRPTAIPASRFAHTLLDVLLPEDSQKDAPKDQIAKVREQAQKLPKSVSQQIVPIIDNAGEELDKLREGFEDWFNDGMSAAGTWYKARAKKALYIIAIVAAAAMNADSIAISKVLWTDDALREQVVALADQVNEGGPKSQATTDLKANMEKLALPLGWDSAQVKKEFSISSWQEAFDKWQAILSKIIGILITGFAAGMGAPFWFDQLRKMFELKNEISGKSSRK